MGPVGSMGMGIARLVYWEWEWEWEWLDGNGMLFDIHQANWVNSHSDCVMINIHTD